ncbi:MAG TPA: type I pullulanase, partial [Mobilitalea sp.]|nr:type I pullulanase [Mobilitalea sp.]
SNTVKLDSGIAVFSDNIRDGIKGSVFNACEQGFVNGRWGMEETIKFGVVASTSHDQIDYWKVSYSNAPWAKEPTQTITYASAHDNLSLWDKLVLSTSGNSREEQIKMNLLAAAIIFTSQGISFFQAGGELLRSKPRNEEGTDFEHNSYNSPDVVNSLKWNTKTDNIEVFNYYKGLIALRKAHKALRLMTTEEIRHSLRFMDTGIQNLVAYTVQGICVILNANPEQKTLQLPEGEWKVYVKGNRAGTEILEIVRDVVTVEAISAVVLVKND